MHPNKRNDSETLEQYHDRLRTQKRAEKIRARGFLVWDVSKRGTYRKAPIHTIQVGKP